MPPRPAEELTARMEIFCDYSTKQDIAVCDYNFKYCLTQEDLGRVISGGEGPGDGINVWRREV